MQLLLLLALLLYGGKGKNAELLNEFRPLIESVGGEEIKQALKEAEQLGSVISALGGNYGAAERDRGGGNAFLGKEAPANGCAAQGGNEDGTEGGSPSCGQSGGCALDPVAGIADKEILYRLAQYFSKCGG